MQKTNIDKKLTRSAWKPSLQGRRNFGERVLSNFKKIMATIFDLNGGGSQLKLMPTPKGRLEEKEIYTKGVIDNQNKQGWGVENMMSLPP